MKCTFDNEMPEVSYSCINGEWFFETSDFKTIGPFPCKDLAQQGYSRYKSQINQCGLSLEADGLARDPWGLAR